MWRFWNGLGLKKRQKADTGHWIEEQKPSISSKAWLQFILWPPEGNS